MRSSFSLLITRRHPFNWSGLSGGSLASTTASSRAAPGEASSAAIAGRTSSGCVAAKPVGAASLGKGDEVDRRERAAEFRIAELALLELHLRQTVILQQRGS